MLLLKYLLVFFLGLLLGWTIGRWRFRFSVSLEKPGDPASHTRWVVETNVRKLELKCECGAVAKFRDPLGSPNEGFQLYPPGDSYTCSQCGRSIDLKQVRSLESDARSS